jgi:hypothetical protein
VELSCELPYLPGTTTGGQPAVCCARFSALGSSATARRSGTPAAAAIRSAGGKNRVKSPVGLGREERKPALLPNLTGDHHDRPHLPRCSRRPSPRRLCRPPPPPLSEQVTSPKPPTKGRASAGRPTQPSPTPTHMCRAPTYRRAAARPVAPRSSRTVTGLPRACRTKPPAPRMVKILVRGFPGHSRHIPQAS